MKSLFKLVFAIAFLFSASASAHVGLASSTPQDGAVLSESPTALTLTFSGEVRLAKVMLHSANGKMHPLDFSMSMTPKATYEIGVNSDLAADDYTVYWTGMGDDGHKMSGEFSFKVN